MQFSLEWNVPAGFYTRKGDENKEGVRRGGAQVTLQVPRCTARPERRIAQTQSRARDDVNSHSVRSAPRPNPMKTAELPQQDSAADPAAWRHHSPARSARRPAPLQIPH